MVKINYIHLQKLEGLEREDIAYSFQEANNILKKWAIEDSPEIGYDKTRIEIVFQNGEKIFFRFDLNKNHKIMVNITDFIVDELKVYAGLKKPYGLTDEQYQEFLSIYITEEDRQKAKQILENYQLED
jgi:light-regulated signal transduction histidine kinase (bacteriophytochrome)